MTKVRNALIEKIDNPYQALDFSGDIIKVDDPEEEPEVIFGQEFIKAGGFFIYCENERAFIDNLANLMEKMNWSRLWCQNKRISSILSAAEIPYVSTHPTDNSLCVSLTSCEALIAATGTVVVSDTDAGSREIFSRADVHIVMAFASQVKSTIKTAMQELNKKYPTSLPTQLTFITGPSRSNAVEQQFIKGVHGPKAIFVFLTDDT